MADTQRKTPYHVLRRVNEADDLPITALGATWAVGAENLTANSAEQAIRIYAEKMGDALKNGATLVAVPSRSFVPVPVSVETQTVIKLNDAPAPT